MTHSAASDLALHCLPMFHKKDASLIWVNIGKLHVLWGICVSQTYHFCSFLASGDCHLLITFPYSLDPDQDQQNVGPDLDPNRLTLSVDDNKSMENYPACKELKFPCFREFIHV